MSIVGSQTAGETRLRILQVVPAYYPAVRYGGPIRSVHGLSAALVRRGHDVHVYTTNIDGNSDLDVPLDRPVDMDGVKVHYFPVPQLRRLCWSPGLADHIRQTIGSFDVAHLHSVFLWPTRVAARAAAHAGVPYLLAPRGMLIRDVVRAKSRLVKSLWISLVERTTISQAAALHVTAELEGDELRAMFGKLVPQILNIPNGVEWPERPLPRAEGPYANLPARYVLFLSRISWKKGLDRLIRAWADVPGVPLVVAGNDDENYQPQLQELVASLGLSERVLFVGPVSDTHKWALYENAELFVLPSYSENFGNVVAEAMAMGCPVLVSPEVGIATLVQSRGAGVVTSCEATELAPVLRRLLDNRDALREYGRRGRVTAESELSWDGIALQTEQCYRRLIQSAVAPVAA